MSMKLYVIHRKYQNFLDLLCSSNFGTISLFQEAKGLSKMEVKKKNLTHMMNTTWRETKMEKNKIN